MLDVLEFEVDANGVEKVFVERILGVAQQKATLAHTTVADDQHFEEVVAIAHVVSTNLTNDTY